jgi:hypothetical protein
MRPPLPSQRPVRVRFRILAACLQVLRIEDIPSSGASGLVVVGTDSAAALVMAGWEMLGSDVIVAYEIEARWER